MGCACSRCRTPQTETAATCSKLEKILPFLTVSLLQFIPGDTLALGATCTAAYESTCMNGVKLPPLVRLNSLFPLSAWNSRRVKQVYSIDLISLDSHSSANYTLLLSFVGLEQVVLSKQIFSIDIFSLLGQLPQLSGMELIDCQFEVEPTFSASQPCFGKLSRVHLNELLPLCNDMFEYIFSSGRLRDVRMGDQESTEAFLTCVASRTFPTLESLSLTGVDPQHLATIAACAPNVCTLQLREIALYYSDDNTAVSHIRALKHLSRLADLSLAFFCGIELFNDCWTEVFPSLRLTRLAIDGERIDIPAAAAFISQQRSLTTLSLRNCLFGEGASFQVPSHVTDIELETDTVVPLANVTSSIEALSYSSNIELDDELRLICTFTSLHTLKLWVGLLGAQALVLSQSLPHLTSLALSFLNGCLEADEVEHNKRLCIQALSGWGKLKRLCLCVYELTEIGADAVLSALRGGLSTVIEELDLSGLKDFSDHRSDIVDIYHILSCSLKTFRVDECPELDPFSQFLYLNGLRRSRCWACGK